MQFVVPQFIDVEDKILGPLSVRQFIILLVGVVFLIAAYRLADLQLFIFEAVVIAVLVIAFAFLRVNGRPFHQFVLSLLQTLKKPRLRIWHRVVTHDELRLPSAPVQTQSQAPTKPPLTASRLAELSLIVDTGGVFQKDATTQ